MGKIILISALLLPIVVTTAFSQDKSGRKLREKNRLEIETLVNSKEFVFVPQSAIPSGMKMINLSSNFYFVKFHTELIDSYLPFFGSGHTGIGYGTDPGLIFKAKPELFNVEKDKNNFHINTRVKAENDIFTISLTIGFQGNASLIISSSKRSTISYNGIITSNED